MNPANDLITELLNFIDASPSPWHAVSSVEKQLQALKFKGLDESNKWSIKAGGRFYVVRDDSSIIAFVLGQKPISETGFEIIGAHTDSPGLRIKPQVGDLLIMEGTILDVNGHVAIVSKVTDKEIEIIQQNPVKIYTRRPISENSEWLAL